MLDRIQQCEPGNQAQVWRTLISAPSPEDFAVGLDFAMEYSYFETDFAHQLRGE